VYSAHAALLGEDKDAHSRSGPPQPALIPPSRASSF